MFQMSFTKRALIVLATISLVSFTGCKIKQETGDQKADPNAAPVAAAPAAPAPVAVDNAKPLPLQVNALPLKGNPNGKVTIVEFSDYE